MRTHYRRSAARSRGPRRKQQWARFDQSAIIPAGSLPGANPQFFDLLASYKAFAYGAGPRATPGVTVDRIRGLLTASFIAVTPTQAFTTTQILIGARMYDTPLVGAVPAVESPVNAPYSDWMWYQHFPVLSTISTSPESDQGGSAHIIDVRSKRRLNELGESLLLAIDLAPSAAALPAATSVQITLGLSLSLLLP